MTTKPTAKEDVGIHPGLQNKLAAELANVLAVAEVELAIFLGWETQQLIRALDALMPTHGPIYDRLNAMIGPDPFSQFVIGRISETLRSLPYEDVTRNLVEIGGYENPEETAKQIVAEFATLPHHYIYSLKLSGIFAEVLPNNNKLPFATGVSVRGGGETMDKWLPLTSGNEQVDRRIYGNPLFLVPHPKSWNGAFLTVDEVGFSADRADTETDARAVETIKSFFGLYMAHNLIERRYSAPQSMLVRPGRANVLVHRWDKDGYSLIRQFPLDEASSNLIADLHFDDHDGKFNIEQLKRNLVIELGAQVAKAFGKQAEAERVRLAGRWLFDSYAGGNELMSFLQAMVVLEIILGDKATSDKIGLGELLKNRCAYMLGKSAADRAEIMQEFGRIYDVRSSIVHRGKSRIRSNERTLFYKLRNYAQKVIRAELELLPETPEYASLKNPDEDKRSVARELLKGESGVQLRAAAAKAAPKAKPVDDHQ